MHRIPLDDGRVVDQQGEGRYLDVFERRGGEWKILHRTFASEALREHSQADLTFELPMPQPAVARRAPDDLSYLVRSRLSPNPARRARRVRQCPVPRATGRCASVRCAWARWRS
jgi:hypothetical protein